MSLSSSSSYWNMIQFGIGRVDSSSFSTTSSCSSTNSTNQIRLQCGIGDMESTTGIHGNVRLFVVLGALCCVYYIYTVQKKNQPTTTTTTTTTTKRIQEQHVVVPTNKNNTLPPQQPSVENKVTTRSWEEVTRDTVTTEVTTSHNNKEQGGEAAKEENEIVVETSHSTEKQQHQRQEDVVLVVVQEREEETNTSRDEPNHNNETNTDDRPPRIENEQVPLPKNTSNTSGVLPTTTQDIVGKKLWKETQMDTPTTTTTTTRDDATDANQTIETTNTQTSPTRDKKIHRMYQFIDCFIPLIDKSNQSYQLRNEVWKKYADINENGYLSLSDIEKYVRKTLERNYGLMHGKEIFRYYFPVCMYSFKDAKELYNREHSSRRGGLVGDEEETTKPTTTIGDDDEEEENDYISRKEFRIFIANMCIYSLMFDAYNQIDIHGKGKGICLNDFIQNYKSVKDHGLLALDRTTTSTSTTTTTTTTNPNDKDDDDEMTVATSIFQEMDVNANNNVSFTEWYIYLKYAELKHSTKLGYLLNPNTKDYHYIQEDGIEEW